MTVATPGSGAGGNQEDRMKRDMDLVRKILLAVEDNEDGNVDLGNIEYGRDQIYLHVELMAERGLVDAFIAHGNDGPGHRILECRIWRLTWEGHDFLDMARRDEIWERAKKMCLKVSDGLAFDILKDCLTRSIKQLIE